MTTTSEIWKPIKEFPGYQVSSLGRVMSTKQGKEKILKQTRARTVNLSNKYYRGNLTVRKLIYSAFHDLELSRLKGIYLRGDTLDTLQAFVLKDFMEEVVWKTRPVASAEIIEKRQIQMLDDMHIVMEAWESGDATNLTQRVLSYRAPTIGYIHKLTGMSSAHAEEVWQSVSTTLIIRIMKKEITVSGFQGWLKISARNLIIKSREQKSRMVQYDDNRLNGENDW